MKVIITFDKYLASKIAGGVVGGVVGAAVLSGAAIYTHKKIKKKKMKDQLASVAMKVQTT